MKILISAYRCEPWKGSEPGVGWNWAVQMAQHHQVWVITRNGDRLACERELKVNPIPNLQVVGYDTPRWERSVTFGSHHLHYVAWQYGVARIARQLHRKIGFDLAHHVTYATYRFPTFIAGLGIPFIWGPVGGGEKVPLRFYGELGVRGLLTEVLRGTHNVLTRFDPTVSRLPHRAALTLVTSPQTARAVSRRGLRRAPVIFPTIGVEHAFQVTAKPHTQFFRALYVGNLLPLKGVGMAIRAFARFKQSHPHSTFTIVGDGPERGRLEELARRLDIAESVTFLGRCARQETLSQYPYHDVLLYPSLRDSGGMACLEAMAAGLPVICLDLGGPSISVTPECGFVIAASSPQQVVRDMAGAMRRLADDPTLRLQMGGAATRRIAEKFVWERKGEAMNRFYQAVAETMDNEEGLRGP